MSIFLFIKRDIDLLEKKKLILNSITLLDEPLEAELTRNKESNQRTLDKLKLLLESGIIPEKYTSVIDNKTYYPSSAELIQRKQPLPPAQHTFYAIKAPRKTNRHNQRSVFRVCDDRKEVLTLYMEHDPDKKYPKGAFAKKVKKGYLSNSDTSPKYAVKVFEQGKFGTDIGNELRVAMCSAYCYQQLLREGVAFRANNKQYLVTNWIEGVSMDSVSFAEIKSVPIERRIVMAISLCRELRILHKLGFIHRDIKPGNIMFKPGWLGFVDLDSVMLTGSQPEWGSTGMYTERFLPSAQAAYDAKNNVRQFCTQFNQSYDIHALGLCFVHLFSEIYAPQAREQKINVKSSPGIPFTYNTYVLLRGERYAEHPTLQKLLKRMCHDSQSFTSIDEVLEQLEELLKTYQDHEVYLHELRLTGAGDTLSPSVGQQAFKGIEIELLGYNQRINFTMNEAPLLKLLETQTVSELINTPEKLVNILSVVSHWPDERKRALIDLYLNSLINTEAKMVASWELYNRLEDATLLSLPDIDSLLSALKSLDQTTLVATLSQKHYATGRSVLMYAIAHEPDTVFPILELISTLSIDQQKQLLLEKDAQGKYPAKALILDRTLSFLIKKSNEGVSVDELFRCILSVHGVQEISLAIKGYEPDEVLAVLKHTRFTAFAFRTYYDDLSSGWSDENKRALIKLYFSDQSSCKEFLYYQEDVSFIRLIPINYDAEFFLSGKNPILHVVEATEFSSKKEEKLKFLLDKLELLPEELRARFLLYVLRTSVPSQQALPYLLNALDKVALSVQVKEFKDNAIDFLKERIPYGNKSKVGILFKVMSKFDPKDKVMMLDEMNMAGASKWNSFLKEQEIAVLSPIKGKENDLGAWEESLHNYGSRYSDLIKALDSTLLDPMIQVATKPNTLFALIEHPEITSEQLQALFENPECTLDMRLKIALKKNQSIIKFDTVCSIIQSQVLDGNTFKPLEAEQLLNSIKTTPHNGTIPDLANLNHAIDRLRIRAYELLILCCKTKEERTTNRSHYDEAKAALALYNELNSILLISKTSTQEEKNRMSQLMHKSINTHEPLLKKDYACKQIIYDIVNALLFIGCLIQYAITGKFRLFDAKPQSTVLLEDIEKDLDASTSMKPGESA